AAAWAITERSGDHLLHVLDQRGAYWRVDHAGLVKLWERNESAHGVRSWDDLGNRDATGNPIGLGTTLPPEIVEVFPASSGTANADVTVTKPWCPIHVASVYLELAPMGTPYRHDDWERDAIFNRVFEGFVAHRWGGALVDIDPYTKAAWYWSARDPGGKDSWANLLEGLCFDKNLWSVTGHWASTGDSASTTGTADKLPFHDLHSYVNFVPIMTQQAMRAVTLPGGQVALVVGCPGGRVHVVRPGTMCTDAATLHQIGTDARLPDDYGFGMSALDARVLPSGDVQIWFGTVYGPTSQPGSYTSAGGSLQNNEVATGVVHTCIWSPSAAGGFGTVFKRPLSPGVTTPPNAIRGGYGVIGLRVGNVLAQAAGDEVVVTTLAGDVIVFNEALTTELWHTHVPGSVGNYNAIRITDLNSDGFNELYVAGSYGLWRFIQPGETGVILP
ncbi:MAG: hypothetical protein ABIP94_13175, partial [Planctomycetota bacterium]